jgi:hypothetical protein
MMPILQTLSEEEILSMSSFSVSARPSPYVEAEFRINYPLQPLNIVLPNIIQVYELLGDLREDGVGIAFGYDLLPEGARLENPADAEFFTGNPSLSNFQVLNECHRDSRNVMGGV